MKFRFFVSPEWPCGPRLHVTTDSMGSVKQHVFDHRLATHDSFRHARS